MANKLTRSEWEELGKQIKRFYFMSRRIKKLIKNKFGKNNEYYRIIREVEGAIDDG